MTRKRDSTDRENAKSQLIGFAVIGAAVLFVVAMFSGGDPNQHPPPAPESSPADISDLLPSPAWSGYGTLCRDGWLSHSAGRGTCSHHGGITP